MTPQDRRRFPPTDATLKDGRVGRLRLLCVDDGERLAEMYAGLDQVAARFYWPHPLDREHALRNVTRADAAREVVLVLELPDGKLGGYAWYRWGSDDAAVSGFGICTASACRGCGIGRLLMTRLMEIAGEVGPPVMTLTCQHANAAAVALYQKMGFRVVREGMVKGRRQWPAEPQFWMERRCR